MQAEGRNTEVAPVLALGSISRVVGDAVPVAPSCYLGCEDDYPGWETQKFADVSLSPEDLLERAFTARRMAHQAIGPLAAQLNRIHNRAYDDRFWTILLIPWLTALSQAVLARDIELRGFLDLHRGKSFRVPIRNGPDNWCFQSINDFWQRGLFSEDFNYWLTGVLALAQSPANWSFDASDEPMRETLAGGVEPCGGVGFEKRILGLAMRRRRFDNVLGVSPVESILYSLYLGAFPGRGAKPAGPDPDLLTAGDISVSLTDVFTQIVHATLPETFTRRFSYLENEARKKPYSPGKLSVKGGVLMFNEAEIFEAAFSSSAGERVVSVQHGGVYGVSLSLPDLVESEYGHHAFVTWGWNQHKGHKANALPLPSPFLSSFRDRHQDSSSAIVLVGTQLRAYGGRLDSSPRGRQVIDYRRDKIVFIEALTPAVRAQFAYRPGPPDETSFEDVPFIERTVGPVQVIRDNFHDAVLSCRLVVIDHLGTTQAISLAANTPTVVYLREEFWPISRDAQPYFDMLADVGIFHTDPISAARHINDVNNDVSGWWTRDDVQSVRLRWIEQFGRTSKSWRREWLKALLEM